MNKTLVQSIREASELRGSSPKAGPTELVIAVGKTSGVYARWEGDLSALEAAVALMVVIEHLLRMTTSGLHALSQANGTNVSREFITKSLVEAIRGDLEHVMSESLEELPPEGTMKTVLATIKKAEET